MHRRPSTVRLAKQLLEHFLVTSPAPTPLRHLAQADTAQHQRQAKALVMGYFFNKLCIAQNGGRLVRTAATQDWAT